MNEEEIRAATVGEPRVHDGSIHLADYDPAWPDLFTGESDRIRSTLGNVAHALEHVGSTSVPGLAAKPFIDIVLVVPDSANEAAYVPALEAIGYALRIEPRTSIALALGDLLGRVPVRHLHDRALDLAGNRRFHLELGAELGVLDRQHREPDVLLQPG